MSRMRYEVMKNGQRLGRALPFVAKGLIITNNSDKQVIVYDGMMSEIARADASNTVQKPIPQTAGMFVEFLNNAVATGIATVDFTDYPLEAKASGVQGPVNVLGESVTQAIALNNDSVNIALLRNANTITIYGTNTLTSRGNLSVTVTFSGQTINIFSNLHLEVVAPTVPLVRQLFMPSGAVINIAYTGIGTFVVQY